MTTFNKMRTGYTTGTCAAAAAKAAALALLAGTDCPDVYVTLPDGQEVCLETVRLASAPGAARFGVIKDAGDDPDVTGGMMICASVSRRKDDAIVIDGGEGVGRVTLPGLDQPVGAAAINSVPRQMIAGAVREAAADAAGARGFDVIIDIPGGQAAAAKTLNGALGIEGGLSVLGTSGIVRPMSVQALLDTIKVEIRQRMALGDKVLYMTPGNYGESFLKSFCPDTAVHVIKISNYIGDSLDMAAAAGAGGVLLTGHIGKMIKVAGGIMNTHSRFADARMEIMAAAAARAGAEAGLIRQILEAKTTEAGLDLIEAAGLREQVMRQLIGRMTDYLRRRCGEMPVGVIVFSNARGLLGMNGEAEKMLGEKWGVTDDNQSDRMLC